MIEEPLCVVDTNVVSYIFRADSRGPEYERILQNYTPTLSFASLAELNRWSMRAQWGSRRLRLLRDSLSRYAILHSTEHTCEWWARIMWESQQKGRPMSANDAWIAATALELASPLVTENVRDFTHLDGLHLRSR